MDCLRTQMRYLNPYDLHKILINEYVLKGPGDSKFLKRDTSKDKTDVDVVKENHMFLWNEREKTDTWELQFAKKYYDKLFKEYCIGDLSLYKEKKIALRWRIKQEVVIGKGQFICGNKKCNEKEELRTWEVNFSYIEQGQKKNALVKIRLCPDCSKKLNYHSKKSEVKRLKKKSKMKSSDTKTNLNYLNIEEIGESSKNMEGSDVTEMNKNIEEEANKEASPWDNHIPLDVKSREEEMEEYLEDLLL